MARLIHVANVPLDCSIEDAHGRFEWTELTDEVFTFASGVVYATRADPQSVSAPARSA